jgi:hypothetical protein
MVPSPLFLTEPMDQPPIDRRHVDRSIHHQAEAGRMMPRELAQAHRPSANGFGLEPDAEACASGLCEPLERIG